jgi:hypothetical protein
MATRLRHGGCAFPAVSCMSLLLWSKNNKGIWIALLDTLLICWQQTDNFVYKNLTIKLSQIDPITLLKSKYYMMRGCAL